VALWGIAGLALLLALVAVGLARRLARKLDALTASYWELRYDFTRLRSQVARIDPETAASAPQEARPETPQPAPTVAFVPLSSMRRKDKSDDGQ
jgi:hypothetical protein